MVVDPDVGGENSSILLICWACFLNFLFFVDTNLLLKAYLEGFYVPPGGHLVAKTFCRHLKIERVTTKHGLFHLRTE